MTGARGPEWRADCSLLTRDPRSTPQGGLQGKSMVALMFKGRGTKPRLREGSPTGNLGLLSPDTKSCFAAGEPSSLLPTGGTEGALIAGLRSRYG